MATPCLLPEVAQAPLDDETLLLQCCVCGQRLREPLLLDCLHDCCRQCAANISSTSCRPPAEGAGPAGGESPGVCPACNEAVNVAGSRLDLFIASRLRALDMHGRGLAAECDSCAEDGKVGVSAHHWCDGCTKALCHECLTWHNKFYKRHHVTALDSGERTRQQRPQPTATAVSPAVPAPWQPALCEQHRARLDFFCFSCQLLKCPDCGKVCIEARHDITAVEGPRIDTYVAQLRESIRLAQASVADKLAIVRSRVASSADTSSSEGSSSSSFGVSDALSRLEACRQRDLERLRRNRNVVAEAMERAYDRAEERVRDCYDAVCAETEEQRRCDEALGGVLRYCLLYSRALLDAADNAGLLYQRQPLLTRLQSLADRTVDRPAEASEAATAGAAVRFVTLVSEQPADMESAILQWLGLRAAPDDSAVGPLSQLLPLTTPTGAADAAHVSAVGPLPQLLPLTTGTGAADAADVVEMEAATEHSVASARQRAGGSAVAADDGSVVMPVAADVAEPQSCEAPGSGTPSAELLPQSTPTRAMSSTASDDLAIADTSAPGRQCGSLPLFRAEPATPIASTAQRLEPLSPEASVGKGVADSADICTEGDAELAPIERQGSMRPEQRDQLSTATAATFDSACLTPPSPAVGTAPTVPSESGGMPAWGASFAEPRGSSATLDASDHVPREPVAREPVAREPVAKDHEHSGAGPQQQRYNLATTLPGGLSRDSRRDLPSTSARSNSGSVGDVAAEREPQQPRVAASDCLPAGSAATAAAAATQELAEATPTLTSIVHEAASLASRSRSGSYNESSSHNGNAAAGQAPISDPRAAAEQRAAPAASDRWWERRTSHSSSSSGAFAPSGRAEQTDVHNPRRPGEKSPPTSPLSEPEDVKPEAAEDAADVLRRVGSDLPFTSAGDSNECSLEPQPEREHPPPLEGSSDDSGTFNDDDLRPADAANASEETMTYDNFIAEDSHQYSADHATKQSHSAPETGGGASSRGDGGVRGFDQSVNDGYTMKTNAGNASAPEPQPSATSRDDDAEDSEAASAGTELVNDIGGASGSSDSGRGSGAAGGLVSHGSGSSSDADERHLLRFDHAKIAFTLMYDCVDVAFTAEGSLLLAAGVDGLLELNAKDGKVLSMWLPPLEMSPYRDPWVCSVQPLEDGRIVVGLPTSPFLLVLRRHDTLAKAWVEDQSIALRSLCVWRLATRGSLIAAAACTATASVLAGGSPGRQLLIVSAVGSTELSLQLLYPIWSLALSERLVVTLSEGRQPMSGGSRMHLVDAYRCDDGELSWRHGSEERIASVCMTASSRVIYVSLPDSRRVMALDGDNGHPLRDVLSSASHWFDTAPAWLSLHEKPGSSGRRGKGSRHRGDSSGSAGSMAVLAADRRGLKVYAVSD